MKKLSNRTIFDIILVAVTVLVWLAWLAMASSTVGASVDTGRPDACRTYNVNFVFEGVENEDHKACGPADYKAKDKQNKPAVTVQIDIPDVPATDDTPAADDTPETPVQDKPEDKPEDKPADQKGNPGNDKSVGNAGEKCDKSMCENADQKTGEHGKSKNDDGKENNDKSFSIGLLLISLFRLKKVNKSYFLPIGNRWYGNHNLEIWINNQWDFWMISPSSANDDKYYCLNLYLGPLNISYTHLA